MSVDGWYLIAAAFVQSYGTAASGRSRGLHGQIGQYIVTYLLRSFPSEFKVRLVPSCTMDAREPNFRSKAHSPGQTMAGQPIGDMDVEYASTVADRAIRSMSQQSVPATPSNFTVWFNYAMGASPALRKTIDILIGNKRKFDASINHELYTTYVGAQSDQSITGDFPEQLHGVIAGAKQFLATAISDNRTQIEALGEVSSQVRPDSDPRPIIAKLVTELTRSTARASALEANFVETAQELDKNPRFAEGGRTALEYRRADRIGQPPLAGGVFSFGPDCRDGDWRAA